MLDKRTVGREVILDREQWKDATMMYKNAYINLYVSQKVFERKKERERANECVVLGGPIVDEDNMKELTAEENVIMTYSHMMSLLKMELTMVVQEGNFLKCNSK